MPSNQKESSGSFNHMTRAVQYQLIFLQNSIFSIFGLFWKGNIFSSLYPAYFKEGGICDRVLSKL